MKTFPAKSIGHMAAIFFASVAFGVVGNGWGLPDIWYGDENFIAKEPITMFREKNPCPETYYYGTFSKYATLLYLSPYLLAQKPEQVDAGDKIFYSTALHLARIFVAIIFGIAALLFYRLLLKLCSRPVALLSAFMLALSPEYVYAGHLVKNTAFLTLLLLLAVLFLANFILSGKKTFLYLASFACGMNSAVQINGGFVFFLVIFATVAWFLGRLDGSDKWKPVKETAVVLMGEFAALGLGLLLFYPCALVHPSWAFYQTYSVVAEIKEGRGLIYPLGLERMPHLLFTSSGLIGLALSVMGLVLYPWKLRKNMSILSRRIVDYLVLPGVIIFYLLYTYLTRMEAYYVLPYLPLYLVFTALFLDFLFSQKAARKSALVFSVLCLVWLAGLAAWIDYAFLRDTRLQAREWIEKNIPPASRIETTYGVPDLQAAYQVNQVDWNYYTPPVPCKLVAFYQNLRKGTLSYPKDSKCPESELYEQRWSNELDDYLRRFSEAGLRERNPDYIIATSYFYCRYLEYPNRYPSTREYWQKLLAGGYDYQIIKRFERPPFIAWTGEILSPEIVVLQRKPR